MTTLSAETEAPEESPAPSERTVKLLSAMAGIGLRGDVLGVLSRFAGVEMTADVERWLTGPLIVHQNGWTETLPKWMLDQVRQERAEIALGHADPRLIVGPTQIAAVMYPAMLEHPMQHDVAQLYLWATTKAAARKYGRDERAIWKSLNMAPITDDEVLNDRGLSGVARAYRQLAQEIRRKVAAYRPTRIARDEEPEAEEAPAPKAIQRDLFSLLAAE
jgi:hypothetical protein